MKILDILSKCTTKKMVALEITTVFVLLSAIGIYYTPKLWRKNDVAMAAKIKADSAVFISKALQEFALDSNIKSSEVAQKVADELNKVEVNQFDKKQLAYTFDKNCKACNSVEYDDELTMIILTSYNKKGELLARTVIKPPSFVTYNKADDIK